MKQRLFLILLLITVLATGCTPVEDTISIENIADNIVLIEVGAAGTSWGEDIEATGDILTIITEKVRILNIDMVKGFSKITTTVILEEPATITISKYGFNILITKKESGTQ